LTVEAEGPGCQGCDTTTNERGSVMIYVGLDVSGKSLVAYAVNERKQWMGESEGAATRAGLRALLPRMGPA